MYIFSKVGIFGSGTYLSTDYSLSLNWSQSSVVRDNPFGSRMACLTICDVIIDTGVKI